MGEIGIRELKQRANEILRQVREKQETFTVTYRGKVVAKLVPVVDASTERDLTSAIWTQKSTARSMANGSSPVASSPVTS